MSKRKLVTIQKIGDLQSIPDADRILLATVMGWNVIVKKDDFNIGDRCVFFEVDSLLPDGPEWSEFMRKKKFRVKTCKLRGAISQGLVLPISILGGPDPRRGFFRKLFGMDGWYVGKDVTGFLKVKKHDSRPKVRFGFKTGRKLGEFPSFIPKTDELRLQSHLKFMDRVVNKPIYITVKCDGTSGTFYRKDGDLVVCSRGRTVKEGDNVYWDVAIKNDLSSKIPDFTAIQGEVCGPGIQKNHLRLSENKLFIFNVFDIKKGKYYSYDRLIEFCKEHELETVPVIYENDSGIRRTLSQWLKMAEGKYEGTDVNREGIVVRTKDQSTSFKVLNNEFLLKEDQ